jgi:hypothetical protein
MIYEALIIIEPTADEARKGTGERIVSPVLPPFVAAGEDGAKTVALMNASAELSKLTEQDRARVKVLLRPFVKAS